MARRPRVAAVTGYYHVVNRAIRKQTLFETRRDYIAFLVVLREGLDKYDVPLVSYCVLSNHWHLLIGPTSKSELTRVIKWVSATHAMRWHRFRGTTGTGPVYQGRFRSTPIHEFDSFLPLTRYVERNARSAGLVERAQDWRWCSLSQRLRGLRTIPLVEHRLLSSELWIDYVNAVITLREQDRESKKTER